MGATVGKRGALSVMLRLSRIHSSDVAKFIEKSVDEISPWVIFKGR